MVQQEPTADKWQGLLRGTIISATTQKLFNYISLADQKAQAMIILNTVLVPVLFNWLEDPKYQTGIEIALVTAILSIMFAIFCIHPRRKRGKKPNGTRNHLHFGDIGQMREADYLAAFMPIFNDPERLSEEAVKDLHDMSRRIIIPKFRWLKLSYSTFFIGNLCAITAVLIELYR